MLHNCLLAVIRYWECQSLLNQVINPIANPINDIASHLTITTNELGASMIQILVNDLPNFVPDAVLFLPSEVIDWCEVELAVDPTEGVGLWPRALWDEDLL